jgi:hypothetical protein
MRIILGYVAAVLAAYLIGLYRDFPRQYRLPLWAWDLK